MTGMNDEGRQWYVVNTYSGHENKVKENLEKRVESMGLQDILFQIVIPEHVETEIKDGKKINKTKNMFPGYVLVEMIMTDEAWYVVIILLGLQDLLDHQVVEQNLSHYKKVS